MQKPDYKTRFTEILTLLISKDISFTMSFRPEEGRSEIHAFGEHAQRMYGLCPTSHLGFDHNAMDKKYQTYCTLFFDDEDSNKAGAAFNCPFCGKPLNDEKYFHQACSDQEQALADYAAEMSGSVAVAGGRI